jgi:uncharacterized membrane protein
LKNIFVIIVDVLKGMYDMELVVCGLIISFYVYGVCGWIWESIVFPILSGHKIHNSGFLNGPIIPIYGVGALVVILLFEQNEKVYSLFLEGGVIACIIEYITSWAMEKIYKRRWWDYSHMPFNLNGRVCLGGFVIFGLFSVTCVKWIQPMLFNYITQYDFITLVIISTALTTLFVTDIVYTIYQMAHIEEHIEHFVNDFEMFKELIKEDLYSSTSPRVRFDTLLDKIKEYDDQQYQEMYSNRKYVEKRILKSFPYLLTKGNRNNGKSRK